MTPWHLIPKETRELVIARLESDARWCECPRCDAKKCEAGFLAAAEILRDAAPGYEAEAIAFALKPYHDSPDAYLCDLLDIDHDHAILRFVDVATGEPVPFWYFAWDRKITPLTPAAAALLEALR